MTDSSSHMAKVKNLKKRIRRLEARLQKGAKKLAKLKRKLETAATATAAKTKAATAVSAEKARKASNASAPTQKKSRSAGDVKQATAAKDLRLARQKKRKLNLTPERRAQLAAAMKARWAAKRAAVAANARNSSSSAGFSPGDASAPQ